MNTIWKYKIVPLDECQTYDMPEGAEIVAVDTDPLGDICFWALVDTEARLVEKKLWCVGTGWPLDELDIPTVQYIGMVVRAPYVWHVLEEVEDNEIHM